MTQSIVGYSGSMENHNMAPLGVQSVPEIGTNGQTIDLLIQQKTEVIVVNSAPEDLFTDLIDSHPQREKIRAIIDVGAHFRGVDNQEVAKLICSKLDEYESAVEGVLLFHSGKLCFMNRYSPSDYTVLSGTSPSVIKQETGLTPDKLFTFYDQEHITGIDITQAPDAIAVLTLKETTQIHEVLQGSRRLRDLDHDQRIIVALAKGAVEEIYRTLNQGAQGEDAGEIKDRKPLIIDDVILYTCLEEAAHQKSNNLLFALQKIENHIQQFILDQMYEATPEQEREIFNCAYYLFDKDITVDLYKEYAHARHALEMEKYLNRYLNGLVTPLLQIFNKSVVEKLEDDLTTLVINKKTLDGIDRTISVVEGLNLNSVNLNHENTQMQYREQSKEQARDEQREGLREMVREVESVYDPHLHTANEEGFQESQFFHPTFGTPTQAKIIRKGVSNGFSIEQRVKTAIWNLNDALKVESKDFNSDLEFDDNVGISTGAALVYNERTDLLGTHRKRPWPMLAIFDANQPAGKQWKLILCSVREGLQFENFLTQSQDKLPSGKQMWLLGSTGKPYCLSQKDKEGKQVGDPNLKRLIVQALLFEGAIKTLDETSWNGFLKDFLKSKSPAQRRQWADFFEQKILMGKPPGYETSPTYTLLHAE
jgi:hypothetical protein